MSCDGRATVTEISLSGLRAEIETRAAQKNRLLVAIAGPPGSGKSTLAEDLAAGLGPHAAVLPMDGFHLDNAQLQEMGLLHRKGAPATFDAEGFAALLGRLRGPGAVRYPTFDRAADSTVPDAGLIDEATRIVLVEGNYLLLTTPPWSRLAEHFDLTVRLEVSRDVLLTRLTDRWIHHGMSAQHARARAESNDMKNVDFVAENSATPDFRLLSQS